MIKVVMVTQDGDESVGAVLAFRRLDRQKSLWLIGPHQRCDGATNRSTIDDSGIRIYGHTRTHPNSLLIAHDCA